MRKEDIPQGRLANLHLAVARGQDASKTARDNGDKADAWGGVIPQEIGLLMMKDAVLRSTSCMRSSHPAREANGARQHRPRFTDERPRLGKAPGDLPKHVELRLQLLVFQLQCNSNARHFSTTLFPAHTLRA